jgi:MFS transporter, DHA1 family, inner membrane transport protein
MDRRLLVLASGMFATGTDGFVVAGVLPQIAHTFQVSIGAAGQMTTAYALSFALLAPTVAAIAGNVPRKLLMLLGLTVFIIGNLATAVAPTFGLALLTRIITGLGAAMYAPTASGSAAMIAPPERRGFALSIVIGGLTTATALGSPLGSVIGGLGDWRWTMLFVSGLGATALVGILLLLSNVPMPPAVNLTQRLAPLADARILLTLATTLLAMSGVFTVYTYFSVVFDRAIGGNPLMFGVLLVVFGASGTFGNLMTGRFVDRLGSRKVLLTVMSVVAADMGLFSWSGARLWTAALAIAIWGVFSWSIQAPQQSRLVSLAPSSAPVVLGLNNSGTYLGVTAAGILGAAGIQTIGVHHLGMLGMLLSFLALAMSELATWRIEAANRVKASLVLA